METYPRIQIHSNVHIISLSRKCNSIDLYPEAILNVVQSLGRVRLFATWTAARQASLSFRTSQSLLRFMSVESMMPSDHLNQGIPNSRKGHAVDSHPKLGKVTQRLSVQSRLMSGMFFFSFFLPIHGSFLQTSMIRTARSRWWCTSTAGPTWRARATWSTAASWPATAMSSSSPSTTAWASWVSECLWRFSKFCFLFWGWGGSLLPLMLLQHLWISATNLTSCSKVHLFRNFHVVPSVFFVSCCDAFVP